ncbi:MAG: hypothetical protein ACE5EX_03685 [Phycisphaerae bacterium]
MLSEPCATALEQRGQCSPAGQTCCDAVTGPCDPTSPVGSGGAVARALQVCCNGACCAPSMVCCDGGLTCCPADNCCSDDPGRLSAAASAADRLRTRRQRRRPSPRHLLGYLHRQRQPRMRTARHHTGPGDGNGAVDLLDYWMFLQRLGGPGPP